MEVFINQHPVSFPEPASLSSVLAEQNLLDRKGIAIAVNNQVVSRTDWDTYQLRPADQIVIIRATQGG